MVHRTASVALAVLVGTGALACASTPTPPPAPAPARAVAANPPAAAVPRPEVGGLSFSVEPDDAEVLVDGRSFGKVADLARSGLSLQPGLYQVSLRRAGYATWRAEVAVRAGVEPIRVTLSRTSPVP